MYDIKEEIENWLNLIGIENYVINKDLTVDVYNNVNISNKNLTEIPVQFGIVYGSFDCSYNKLISLLGCPYVVKNKMYCNGNKLKSLKYLSEDIGLDLVCSENYLTSLKGCPNIIKGYFNCSDNELTSLEGCPEIVEKSFNCVNNSLTNLKYGPKEVKGDYYCAVNELTSLEGVPLNMHKNNLTCQNNKIISLEYFPNDLRYLNIDNNQLEMKDFLKIKDKLINIEEIKSSYYTGSDINYFISLLNSLEEKDVLIADIKYNLLKNNVVKKI